MSTAHGENPAGMVLRVRRRERCSDCVVTAAAAMVECVRASVYIMS